MARRAAVSFPRRRESSAGVIVPNNFLDPRLRGDDNLKTVDKSADFSFSLVKSPFGAICKKVL
jgi:hypothetical protein